MIQRALFGKESEGMRVRIVRAGACISYELG
jgi:hypothetical protein